MQMKIKPKKPHVQVRKPDGTHLCRDGESVKRTSFWLRRLNDGDVEVMPGNDSGTPKHKKKAVNHADA